jgi:tetratricopeptide (TPR) repeat protein
VLGTAGYLSPEQARGESATAASDRYALGVVAFELLTGRRPFAADTPVTEAFAHINASIPSAHDVAPSLPAAVDAVLSRALAKEPSERPGTASELVEDLRDALQEDEAETRVLAGAVPVASSSRERRGHGPGWPVALLGAAAILLAGAGTAAVLTRNDDGSPPERTVTRVRTLVTTVSDTASTITVTQPTVTEEEPVDGAALNDAGFARMQAEDYQGALPLLEQAVDALSGSGELAEAYASYNLAFTRFALGSCARVLELLDRSEQIQGERREIDQLRRDAERQCDGGGPGNGNGKGKRGEGDG